MEVDRARELRATGLLLLTAAIWGFSFVAQRRGMEHVGPFTFNAIRFAIGSLVLLPLVLRRRARSEPGRFRGAHVRRRTAVLGGVLFLGASLQQSGIVTTSAGKTAFITGLYVVLVPLFGRMLGYRIGPGGWSGAALAVSGLWLLSVRQGQGMAPGDLLVLIGAFCWAVHVMLIDRWSGKVDPVELAFRQFAVCAVLSLPPALATEEITLAALAGGAPSICYAGFLSVAVAYTLQAVAQRDAQPTVAAILLSLETVFAALGGYLLLSERLSSRDAVGCGLMLCGVLVSQLWKKRRTADQRA